jgi:hypothetical protein
MAPITKRFVKSCLGLKALNAIFEVTKDLYWYYFPRSFEPYHSEQSIPTPQVTFGLRRPTVLCIFINARSHKAFQRCQRISIPGTFKR